MADNFTFGTKGINDIEQQMYEAASDSGVNNSQDEVDINEENSTSKKNRKKPKTQKSNANELAKIRQEAKKKSVNPSPTKDQIIRKAVKNKSILESNGSSIASKYNGQATTIGSPINILPTGVSQRISDNNQVTFDQDENDVSDESANSGTEQQKNTSVSPKIKSTALALTVPKTMSTALALVDRANSSPSKNSLLQKIASNSSNKNTSFIGNENADAYQKQTQYLGQATPINQTGGVIGAPVTGQQTAEGGKPWYMKMNDTLDNISEDLKHILDIINHGKNVSSDWSASSKNGSPDNTKEGGLLDSLKPLFLELGALLAFKFGGIASQILTGAFKGIEGSLKGTLKLLEGFKWPEIPKIPNIIAEGEKIAGETGSITGGAFKALKTAGRTTGTAIKAITGGTAKTIGTAIESVVNGQLALNFGTAIPKITESAKNTMTAGSAAYNTITNTATNVATKFGASRIGQMTGNTLKGLGKTSIGLANKLNTSILNPLLNPLAKGASIATFGMGAYHSAVGIKELSEGNKFTGTGELMKGAGNIIQGATAGKGVSATVFGYAGGETLIHGGDFTASFQNQDAKKENPWSIYGGKAKSKAIEAGRQAGRDTIQSGGVLAGAIAGAAIGTAAIPIPIVGTAVGAAVGAGVVAGGEAINTNKGKIGGAITSAAHSTGSAISNLITGGIKNISSISGAAGSTIGGEITGGIGNFLKSITGAAGAIILFTTALNTAIKTLGNTGVNIATKNISNLGSAVSTAPRGIPELAIINPSLRNQIHVPSVAQTVLKASSANGAAGTGKASQNINVVNQTTFNIASVDATSKESAKKTLGEALKRQAVTNASNARATEKHSNSNSNNFFNSFGSGVADALTNLGSLI